MPDDRSHEDASPEQLDAERARLLRERAELQGRLETLEGELHRVTRVARAAVPRAPIRPARGLVLDLLDDIAWPTFTRELAAYSAARYGRHLAPTRFGALMSDEISAYTNRFAPKSRPRTVWICYGLTWNHAEPIKRLLCRSDWPLENRIVAPTSGRVQYLRVTARLCEIAEKADAAADPDMLRMIAADHARDIVGVNFKRGQFPLKEWRDAALAMLREVEPRDEALRREAAEHLAQTLGEQALLFGAPEAIIGADDSEQRRRIG